MSDRRGVVSLRDGQGSRPTSDAARKASGCGVDRVRKFAAFFVELPQLLILRGGVLDLANTRNELERDRQDPADRRGLVWRDAGIPDHQGSTWLGALSVARSLLPGPRRCVVWVSVVLPWAQEPPGPLLHTPPRGMGLASVPSSPRNAFCRITSGSSMCRLDCRYSQDPAVGCSMPNKRYDRLQRLTPSPHSLGCSEEGVACARMELDCELGRGREGGG